MFIVHICFSLLKMFQTRRGTIFIPPSVSSCIKEYKIFNPTPPSLPPSLSPHSPLQLPSSLLVHLYWTEERGQVQDYFPLPPSATPWSITYCVCVCVCMWESHGCGVPCTVCLAAAREETQSDWADGRVFPVGLVCLVCRRTDTQRAVTLCHHNTRWAWFLAKFLVRRHLDLLNGRLTINHQPRWLSIEEVRPQSRQHSCALLCAPVLLLFSCKV